MAVEVEELSNRLNGITTYGVRYIMSSLRGDAFDRGEHTRELPDTVVLRSESVCFHEKKPVARRFIVSTLISGKNASLKTFTFSAETSSRSQNNTSLKGIRYSSNLNLHLGFLNLPLLKRLSYVSHS